MKASELLHVLKGVDPDAQVVIAAVHNPTNTDGPGEASGDVLYIAVTNIDGKDRVVGLCNCVEDSKGNHVFDAPPQFKRFSISSGDGPDVAIADLKEQMNGEPTEDLRLKQQVEQLEQWIDSRLNPKEKING